MNARRSFALHCAILAAHFIPRASTEATLPADSREIRSRSQRSWHFHSLQMNNALFGSKGMRRNAHSSSEPALLGTTKLLAINRGSLSRFLITTFSNIQCTRRRRMQRKKCSSTQPVVRTVKPYRAFTASSIINENNTLVSMVSVKEARVFSNE